MNNKIDDKIDDKIYVKIDDKIDVKIDDIENIKTAINITNKIITNIKLIPFFICNGECNKCIKKICN